MDTDCILCEVETEVFHAVQMNTGIHMIKQAAVYCTVPSQARYKKRRLV